MPIDYPPQILQLTDGATLKAATTATEGDLLQPHPNDAGRGEIWTAVDVSGTLHWLGREQVTPTNFDDDAVINVGRAQDIQLAARSSRRVLLVSLDGHWDQTSGTTVNNYFTMTLTYRGATLASFSTQSDQDDNQVRIAQAINTIVDYSLLDNEVDAARSRQLRLVYTETGNQSLSWAVGLAIREILE